MAMPDSADAPGADSPVGTIDATEPVERLLRDLRSSRSGLSGRRRRGGDRYGPNQLHRRGGRHVWREVGRQFSHPLALLLWAAAGLAWLAGIVAVAIAIVIVIFLNALFAFVQEMQAERAVEALQAYLPQHATVLRDGAPVTVEAVQLVAAMCCCWRKATGLHRQESGLIPVLRKRRRRGAFRTACPRTRCSIPWPPGMPAPPRTWWKGCPCPAWWQGRVTRPRLTAGPLSMPRVCAWVMRSGSG